MFILPLHGSFPWELYKQMKKTKHHESWRETLLKLGSGENYCHPPFKGDGDIDEWISTLTLK